MTIPLKIIKKQDIETIPNQEAVWNAIAKPWKTYVVKTIPIIEEFLKPQKSKIFGSRKSIDFPRNKKGKVIDLGCGTGRNMIPNPNIEYHGVDFSEGQLKQARKYIKKNKIKAKLYKSSADNLEQFKNDTFDYGLFIATLHCIETKEKRKKALEEFYRVLKNNSQSLISIWDSRDKRFNHVNNQGDIYMSWKENNIPYMRYYYLFQKQEFLDLLKNVGFKIQKFYKPKEHDRFSKKNWIIKIEK